MANSRFTFGKRFNRAVRWLRKNHAPKCGLPVYIRTKKKLVIRHEACWGSQEFFPGKKWVITLDRSQSESHAIETLIHEFSHVLQDEVEPSSDSPIEHHSDQWGIFYARLYRGFYDGYERENDGEKSDV